MQKELESRVDIENLVNNFYEKVRADELLGPIFNEIANVDWAHHLPKMYAFWDFILFDKEEYQGHPLRPHLQLNSFHQLDRFHFDRWLKLFEAAVNELFVGKKAIEAIERAKGIGATWASKIEYLNKLDG